MAESELLKNMVMNFRVSELTMLLSFAGRSRSGRKTELQLRSLELIKLKSTPINCKIRELYRSIQQQTVAMGPTSAEPPPTYMPISTRSTTSSQHLSPSKSSNYLPADVERAALQARNPYTSAVGYPGYNPSKSGVSSSTTFPINPDVKFKKLPFFDTIAELLRPSSLVPQGNTRYHETSFVFHL